MSVIDFHSHVLPRIDDGSHSSEESLGMLQISASQGIDVMAANVSIFYATEDRISSFFEQKKVFRRTFEGTDEPGTDKRREDSKADNGSGGRLFLQA